MQLLSSFDGKYFFSILSCIKQQGDESINKKDYLKDLAEYHFRNGKNRNDVAKELGISLRKLYKLYGGKDQVLKAELLIPLTTLEVENALLKKACGFIITEEKEKGDEVTTVHKEVPPDTTAARLWLESKCPEIWRQKSENPDAVDKVDQFISELDKAMKE